MFYEDFVNWLYKHKLNTAHLWTNLSYPYFEKKKIISEIDNIEMCYKFLKIYNKKNLMHWCYFNEIKQILAILVLST